MLAFARVSLLNMRAQRATFPRPPAPGPRPPSSLFSALLERLFNHAQRSLGDLQLLQIPATHPFDGADVVTGGERAPSNAADVVDQYIVVFGGSGRIAHDALEDLEDGYWLAFEARLLAHFAADAVGQGLADLERAAGQRPPALERRLAALRHQDAVATQDQR